MNHHFLGFRLSILLLFTTALGTSLPGASISVQPSSQTVANNSQVTFSVSASGNGEVSYQWKKDGVNIPSAVANSYSIPRAKPWHIGEYSVSVSDSGGGELSLPASLNLQGENAAIWKGLIYFWPMNGNANDKGVLQNHFSVNYATLSPDKDGNDNSSYYFNGSSASMVSEAASVIAGSSPRTISFWFKHADLNYYLGKPVMFGWGEKSHSGMLN